MKPKASTWLNSAFSGFASATFALTLAAPAAVQVYDSTNPAGVWDNSTVNWDNSTTTWTNGNDASFETGTGTVNVVGTIGLREWVVTSTAESTIAGVATSVYRFNGGTLSFGSTLGVIDTAATGLRNSQINSNLTGSAGLEIYSTGGDTGQGRLVLGGENSNLSGGITVKSGLVAFTKQAATGPNTITLDGGGIFGCVNHSGTAASVVNGVDQALFNNVVLQASASRIRVWGGRNLTLGGTLSGEGGLRKADTGALLLAGATTFTGEVNVFSGALLSRDLNTLGTGTITLGGSGQPAIGYFGTAQSTARTIHHSTASGGIVTSHGNLTLTNAMTGVASPFGLILNGGGVGTMNGISSGALINFNKQGFGTWNINGPLTLTGGEVRPQGGVLSFSSTSSTATNAAIAGRANGGVIRFATGSSVLTGSVNTNGILGGWATVDNTTWAKTNGAGNPVDGFIDFTADTWAAGTNTNVTPGGPDPATDSTTHSLRFNAPGAKTVNLAGTNRISSGGIMVTGNVGSNETTISGGMLTAAVPTADLVIHQFNTGGGFTLASLVPNLAPARTGTTATGTNTINGLSNTSDLAAGMTLTGTGIPAGATISAINSATQITISANATANGTPSLTIGAIGLTKTGPGTAVLAGANNYTGTTRVFEGTLRVTANSGPKLHEVASGATLELGYSTPASVYGYGVTVSGAGTLSAAGLYLVGGNLFNLQSTLRLTGLPSTVRSSGTGNASLVGWDNNGTHLAVEATASGSVLASGIQFAPGGFGYVMNIAAGAHTLTGDATLEGPLTGAANASNHFRKVGGGSLRITAPGTSTAPLQIRQGTVILSGGDNRLAAASNVRLGELTDSGRLVLEGVNQTLTSLANAGTGTENRVVGGGVTLSTITINNAGDTTIAAALGGSTPNENNLAIAKTGTGALTLAGMNSFTGDTTTTAGVLRLDYSTHNSSKLSDTGTLTLGGGLTLSGGSHEEVVGATIITGSAAITRTDGAAVIHLGALSRTGSATLNLESASLAKTTTPNDPTGRLPTWVSIDGSPAAVDANGNIIPFVPTYTDIVRLGGKIPNNATANVRIINGGTTGPVTPTNPGTTAILSLTQAATAGPVMMDLGAGNTLRLGELGTVTAAPGASDLTIQGGNLTAGGAPETPGTLAITGEAVVRIDSSLQDNGFAPLALVKSGPGTLTLGATNDHTGGVTLNGGQLLLGHEFSLGIIGAFTINGGAYDNVTGEDLLINDPIPQTWNGNFTYLGSDDLTFQGGEVSITGSREVTVAASTLELRSLVSGASGFSKLGAGTLLLSGAGNNWTGTTTVKAGVLGVPSRLADGPYVVESQATLRLGYVTGEGYAATNLKLHGDGVTATTGLYLRGGASYNASGTIELLTAPTTIRHYGTGLAAIGMFDNNGNGMNVSAAASGSVIDENIQLVSRGYGMTMIVAQGLETENGDLVVNGPLNVAAAGFFKRGPGSVRLNGTATAGNLGMLIQGGRVIAGAANAIGANAILPISTGASLDLNGFSQESASLSGGGSIFNGGASMATLTVNQNADATFSGILGGSTEDQDNFALVKDGPANLTLTAFNFYTGDTTLEQGTLTLTQPFLSDAAAVRITTGSTLALAHDEADEINALFVDGVQLPANTYTASNSSFITGSGSLVVATGPAAGSAYDNWLIAAGLTPGAPRTGPNESYDGSGVSNRVQFALGGDVLDPAKNGVQAWFTKDASNADNLVLTIAVRSGSNFAGSPSPTATRDGVVYTIQGGTSLATWTTNVEETAVQNGGGTVTAPAGYILKSFRLIQSPALSSQGFLRVRIAAQ